MIERALFLNEKIRKWPFRVIFSSHRWLVCNEMWDFRANLVKFGEKRKLKLDTVVSFRVLKGHPSWKIVQSLSIPMTDKSAFIITLEADD